MARNVWARRLTAALVGSLFTFAIAIGTIALFTEANAAPRCICPQVYAPVTCDNGKTYPNLCVANCKRATGCVPVIVLPPPL